MHGSDEILWTITGVGKEATDARVVDCLRVCVEAAVGNGEVMDW